ncbi:MAG: hypothetical protein LBQ81_04200 [Zoogloeaceae bacterium]|jgi:hypothetical protein|nr:hypothetical protein [Zoogloeaceae bacterium]
MRILPCLLLCCCALTLPVQAQQNLEIIELQHRSLEEVLPVLRPLLERGATLSGIHQQLFLRASARNREEIRRVLATLDVPARRLLIRVTTELSEDMRRQGGQISGSLGNDRARVVVGNGARDGNQVTARVYDSHSAGSGASTQMVRTEDGGRAFIQVGVSVPVPLRQIVQTPNGATIVSNTMEYRDIGKGFYAEPRVSGDRVRVNISQQSDTPGRYGVGNAQIQHLATSVSGRLGEWMQLGGTSYSSSGGGNGSFSISTDERRENRGIWLMVEELP